MAALAIGGAVLGTVSGLASARANAAAAETQGVAAEAQAAFDAFRARFEGDIDAVNFLNQAESFDFNREVARQMGRVVRETTRADSKDFRRRMSARLATSRALEGTALKDRYEALLGAQKAAAAAA